MKYKVGDRVLIKRKKDTVTLSDYLNDEYKSLRLVIIKCDPILKLYKLMDVNNKYILLSSFFGSELELDKEYYRDIKIEEILS